MNPERVFQILSAIGLIAGGWLYGDYWKKSESSVGNTDGLLELRAENAELTQQIDTLEGELAQVRSMLANGPYPIPDELIAWCREQMANYKVPRHVFIVDDLPLTASNKVRKPELRTLATELLGK